MGGKSKTSEGRVIMVSRPARGNMMSRLRQSSCIVLAGYLLIWLFVQFPAHKQETDVVLAKSAEVVLPVQKDSESDVTNKQEEQKPVEINTAAQNSSVQKVEMTDCERLSLELKKYDWNADLMLAIAKAESSCRINAVGDTSIKYVENGREYGYSVGFFQIRILPGREHCDVFDVETNVACAYNIYKGQGLNAWSVYSNGIYAKYL